MEGSAFVLYNSNMALEAATSAIQVYNLFGEYSATCRTSCIAKRSRRAAVLHDWVLAPHRHARLHQVLLIDSGGGQATLDGRDARAAADASGQRAGRHVHGFSFEPGTQGWVLTIATEVLDEALMPSEGLAACCHSPPCFAARPRCAPP